MRPSTKGPRSLTRTSADWLVSRLVTRTRVPKGSVLCAAVSWCMSYTSPLAVRRPWWGAPYHEAIPTSSLPATGGTGGVVMTAREQPASRASAANAATSGTRLRGPAMAALSCHRRRGWPRGYPWPGGGLVLSGVS